MANEINLTAALNVTKGFTTISRNISGFKCDWTGSLYDAQKQIVGTTPELLDITTDITTAGWAIMRNASTSGIIYVGVYDSGEYQNFEAMIKMKPGDPALFRLAETFIYVKASQANTVLEWIVLED